MNKALLRNRLNRAELLALPLSERNGKLAIAVHRNHAFELVASVLNPFLNESGLTAECRYSGYDDSLAFGDFSEADLHLVWLDAARYASRQGPEELGAWLADRLSALRALSAKPILAVCCGMPAAASVAERLPPDTVYCDLDADLAPERVADASSRGFAPEPVANESSRGFAPDPTGGSDFPRTPSFPLHGALPRAAGNTGPEVPGGAVEAPPPLYSDRLAALTGTRLTNEGALLAARLLGLRYLPALALPALKGLVLDLDNTLYRGVLGEDGAEGVRPYVNLQSYIKSLKERGFLLALASKNEEEDVRDLFARRADFPLTWDDFAATAIGWTPKAEGIQKIAAAFNIGTEALLFVDDNPGEIAQAVHAIPGLHTLSAGTEEETLQALRWQPGLHKIRLTAEDAFRSADIAANARREALRASASPREYLRELALELSFALNPGEQQKRVTELLNKTNQFLLSYLRPGESEVAAFLREADKCVITAAMKDKLSDSGVIAVILMQRQEEATVVRELAVSCRALGRGVERDMLAAMLRLGHEALGSGPPLALEYKRGPRNGPGLAWLQSLAGADLADQGSVALKALPVADLELVRVNVSTGAPA